MDTYEHHNEISGSWNSASFLDLLNTRFSVKNVTCSSKTKKVTVCIATLQQGSFTWPLLQWESNRYCIFRAYVCSLRYSACNAHAPYCHMWTGRLYNIFQLNLMKHQIFGKTVIENNMCDLIFSTAFVWNISHYRWIQQDTMISAHSLKVPVILVRFLMKLVFSG